MMIVQMSVITDLGISMINNFVLQSFDKDKKPKKFVIDLV